LQLKMIIIIKIALFFQDHLTEFHQVNRIWRHLLMLKRSGRGHDPEGAAATTLGELAIECPACPHPDRNLPLNWDSGGPQEYFIQLIAQKH
jgi:hypothetical protein